jgi:sulfonate transport system substrate-binding protein
MKWKILLIFVLGLLSLGGFQGVATGAEPVRIAYIQSVHHLPLWVALEKGYFKENGVDVAIEGIFRAGPEIMSAFSAGSLDMAYVGIAPTITAVANKTAQVFVLAQVNADGSAIVVGNTSPIQSIPDLSGKTVAVPGASTVQDFLLKKALTNSDLAMNRVNIIVLKPPEMIGALRADQIDAFNAWEPFPAKAVTSGVGRILVTSKQIWPNHPCCVLVADTNFVKRHSSEIKAVLRSHVRAIEFINNNPEEAVKIAVKYSGMDEQTIRKAMENVTFSYQLDAEGIQEYVRFLGELNYIKVTDPQAFVNGLIKPGFLEEIRSQ